LKKIEIVLLLKEKKWFVSKRGILKKQLFRLFCISSSFWVFLWKYNGSTFFPLLTASKFSVFSIIDFPMTEISTLFYVQLDYYKLGSIYKTFLQSVSQIWASLISQWWFSFRLKPIFNTAPAACKNTAQFKSGQN
jgi:hypothetical protein